MTLDEYDGVQLIKKGFVYDFLRVVIIKPIATMTNAEMLKDWFAKKDEVPLPGVSWHMLL